MNVNITIGPELLCPKCKEGYILPLFEYINANPEEEEAKLEACLSGWACSNPECNSNVFYDYSAEKPCLRTLSREKA
jgi:uncharacterized protein (DUF983 family)